MTSPEVSIVIIARTMSSYLEECISRCLSGDYQRIEIIVVLNEKTSHTFPKTKIYVTDITGPSEKRNFGVTKTRGKYVSFIDDDAYPEIDRLSRVVNYFSDKRITAVVGPGITPPNVTLREEASGWAVSSPIGSGQLIYRFLPGSLRYVDDFPTMNLTIIKKDFISTGGFDRNFYPGEDTKLSHDLVYKIHKRIIYDPKVVMYHHRRPLWLAHLRQYGNYGIHRGYFARIFPKTSARIIYFLPAFLPIGSILYFGTLFFSLLSKNTVFTEIFIGITIVFIFYLILLFLNALWITYYSKKIVVGILSLPAVLMTHMWYGLRFIQGFLFFNRPVSEEYEE